MSELLAAQITTHRMLQVQGDKIEDLYHESRAAFRQIDEFQSNIGKISQHTEKLGALEALVEILRTMVGSTAGTPNVVLVTICTAFTTVVLVLGGLLGWQMAKDSSKNFSVSPTGGINISQPENVAIGAAPSKNDQSSGRAE